MYNEKKVYALIVAAGKGRRMGAEIPKQFLVIDDKMIIDKTIMQFEKNKYIDGIVLVIDESEAEFVKKNITYNRPMIAKIVYGGDERMISVYNGLMSFEEDMRESIVLIHDGVRPFTSQNLINTCIKNAYEYGACVPVIDLTDTVKQVNKKGFATKTIDRSKYKAVQTPQGFKYEIIFKCYENALIEGFDDATDDASLAEHYKYDVKTIPGLQKNIKITTPFDLRIAEIISRMV